jgi:hypothetical protein
MGGRATSQSGTPSASDARTNVTSSLRRPNRMKTRAHARTPCVVLLHPATVASAFGRRPGRSEPETVSVSASVSVSDSDPPSRCSVVRCALPHRPVALSVGIVGLPNVGKSTLFNALSEKRRPRPRTTRSAPSTRTWAWWTCRTRAWTTLVKYFKPQKIIPATVEFVDIAGLVKGASKGEGRGNAFLTNIRDCDAIAHVVRCFDDENVVHVDGRVNPARATSRPSRPS